MFELNIRRFVQSLVFYIERHCLSVRLFSFDHWVAFCMSFFDLRFLKPLWYLKTFFTWIKKTRTYYLFIYCDGFCTLISIRQNTYEYVVKTAEIIQSILYISSNYSVFYMILIFNGCFLNFTFYLYGSDDIFQIYIFCLSNAMQAVYKLVFIYLVLNYMFFLNKSHCKNREIEKQKIAHCQNS